MVGLLRAIELGLNVGSGCECVYANSIHIQRSKWILSFGKLNRATAKEINYCIAIMSEGYRRERSMSNPLC